MANERVWSLATIEEFWNKVKNLVSGYKIKQTAVNDPSASGTGVTFIDSISQNANGVIVPTKKTVRTMGGASASAAGSAGLAPAPAAGNQGKFLRGDGTWANTPYPGTMTGATASTAGSAGLVPAPSAGNQDKFLRGNGTWVDGLSPNNVANNLTTETAGKVLDARQGTALKTELAAVESGLAYRETGATASRNISDGEYVFWNGAMYKANGNIASGTTLASGTNLTPTENALNALNSNLFTDYSNGIDIKSQILNNGYTAPSNGIVIGRFVTAAGYNYVRDITVNGTIVNSTSLVNSVSGSNVVTFTVSIPLKKGSVIKTGSYGLNYDNTTITFYPCN